MKNRLLIAAYPFEGVQTTATVLFSDGRPVEFYLAEEDVPPLLHGIFVGRIEKVQKNIRAAFVRFQKDRTGYLPLREGLREGDELLVQVEKDAMKEKLPRLTEKLTLTGSCFVLTAGEKGIGWSRKITKEGRARLEGCITAFYDAAVRSDLNDCPDPDPYRDSDMHSDPDTRSDPDHTRPFGVIVRTCAAEASDAELEAEWKELSSRMREILHYGKTRTLYTRLLDPETDASRILKTFGTADPADFDVVTDLPEVYERLQREFPSAPARLYADPLLPLFRLYKLTTVLTEASAKKVWLPSGGFLVIEQTEAFAAIDVNTGRTIGRKSAEDTAYLTDLEAAEEAARQIRLRQLSGMILIDFINLDDAEHEASLIRAMREDLQTDPVRPAVIDMTKLGILEITRRKIRRPLAEQLARIRAFRTEDSEVAQKVAGLPADEEEEQI